MIAVALDVVRVLVLLVPAVICVAWPETVRDFASEMVHRRRMGRAWEDALSTTDFIWLVRLTGAGLIALSALLALAILPGR